ncbi:activator of basal transcription 1 [Aplochiton taeniatus]
MTGVERSNDDAEGEDDDNIDDDDDDDDETNNDEPKAKTIKVQPCSSEGKKTVPGIVYLGHIPPRLRPKHMRNMLSPYGEIGRIFLQPEDRSVKWKKKKAGSNASSFTEGWVEFRSKRIAKRVATSLHNTPMGARKSNRFSSDLWCIKYLNRFQWCHLSERLAYERTVLQQRLRTEIAQAKRETNFYLSNVEKSQSMDKLRKRRDKRGEKVDEKTWNFTQRRSEDEIQLRKLKLQSMSRKDLDKAKSKTRDIQEKSRSNISLLTKIFNGKSSQD